MTIYYVDGAVGNDSNDGLAEGSGNAWATIGEFFNNRSPAPGDTLYVKASATYDESVTITTAQGNITNPVSIIGYSSTPGDLGHISWTNTGAGVCWNALSITYPYMHMENIDFNNSANDGINIAGTHTFYNCKFRNNSGHGADLNGFGDAFLNCEFTGNSSYGIHLGAAQQTRIFGCIFATNAFYQVFGTGNSALIYRCLFYGVVSQDIFGLEADSTAIIACTMDGDGSSGWAVDAGSDYCSVFVDNIVHDIGNGIRSSEISAATKYASIYANNIFSSIAGSPIIQNQPPAADTAKLQHNYEIPPGFNDEANDDYTLAEGSGAINKGLQPGCVT